MKILHLEDNSIDAEFVREILAADFPDCVVNTVDTREHFLGYLMPEAAPNLILSDFSLPAFDGLSALKLARDHAPGVPFVFLSGSIGEERAIAAVRAGAYDYVLKDNPARLSVVIHRALDEYARRRIGEQDERRLLEFGGIIDWASEAIVVSDLSGRITLWNRGAARLYGVPTAAAVGRRAEEIFPPEELANLRAARDAIQAGREWRGEIKIATRDGRNLAVDVRMTLVRDATGRPLAQLSIANDITEKKKLEEQFLRAQRLEGLGLLAAGIAHDFNNVLAPLVMAAPMLRLRATHPGDLRMLDIVEKSSARGAGLVRQILGFARGASGGFQLTQLQSLIRDFEEVIRASFPKSIVLETRISTDLPPIQANPTQIHQILLNLAVNARDAMPRGGTLRICAEVRLLDELGAMELAGARPGEFVVVEVADSGQGMTPEVLARIWDPFFTTKDEGKGTGLGLSTSRGIAAAHGGFVAVETQVGRGTSFRVYFPIAERSASAGAAVVPIEEPMGQGELILLVDDEADLREVTEALLTRQGYRTLTCGDGVEAIALFTEHSAEIQMVITDVNMPKMDGTALALVLRRLCPGLGILAVTGLDSRGASGAQNAGVFTEKLPKPFTAEALRAAVSRTLLRTRAARPQ